MSEENNKKAWWEILVLLTPLISGVFVTSVGLYLTYSSNQQQSDFEKRKSVVAHNDTLLVTVLDKLAPLLTSDDFNKRRFGYRAMYALGEVDVANKLISATDDPAGLDPMREKAKQLEGTLNAKEAEKMQTTASSLTVLIYMQLADISQKQSAEETRKNLLGILNNDKKSKYIIPNIGSVVGAAPTKTEVRYFNVSDEPIAKDITNKLIEKGVKDATSSQNFQYEVNKGNLEIWFSKNAFNNILVK
ncbi:MAG: hypothetical protein NTW85_13240 [Methylococcales bacterium]|nr:hypothetical protein [Methylococcales bacterium]